MSSCHYHFPVQLAKDLSPNQQPDYATDYADGGKGRDDPEIDQCDAGLLYQPT